MLNFHALTWITPDNPTAGGNNGVCEIGNHSPPCWGANVITSGSGITVGGCGTTGNDVEGCSNQSAIAAGDNGIDNTALVPQQFAEFGVNLTKALGLTGCNAFPQEVWESRSSGSSFTSNTPTRGESARTKTSAPLPGATFSITGPNNYSNSVTTGSDGTVSFTDTPLSDFQVNFRDGGSGATSATISCDNSTGTSSTATATGWDTSLTVTGVKVSGLTTVHCTITIDP